MPSPSAGPSQTDAEGSTEATENKVSNAECRKPAKVAKPWKTKQKPSVSPSDSEKKSHNKKEDKTNSASSNKANGSKSSTPATKSSAGSEEKRHSSCGGSNREESAPKRNKTKSSRPEEISSPKKEVVTTTTGKDQRQKVEKTEAHKDESPDTPDSGIERDLASPEKINNNPFSPGNVSVFGDHMSASEFDDPQPSTSSVAPRFGRNRRISDILAESTQLSPLLSPIPEISFPPFFEDPSGFPHLLARLNFSLLSKIPPPPLSPVPSVAPSDQSVSSRQNNRKSHANDKDDLDGMPLLDRLNSSNSFSDKKSKKNSSNGSETTSKVPSSTKSQPKIEADLTKKSKSDQKPGQMKPSDHHTAKKHSTSSGVVVTESHHTKSLSTPYQSSPPSTIDSVVLSVVTQMSKDSTNNKSPSM